MAYSDMHVCWIKAAGKKTVTKYYYEYVQHDSCSWQDHLKVTIITLAYPLRFINIHKITLNIYRNDSGSLHSEEIRNKHVTER